MNLLLFLLGIGVGIMTTIIGILALAGVATDRVQYTPSTSISEIEEPSDGTEL